MKNEMRDIIESGWPADGPHHQVSLLHISTISKQTFLQLHLSSLFLQKKIINDTRSEPLKRTMTVIREEIAVTGSFHVSFLQFQEDKGAGEDLSLQSFPSNIFGLFLPSYQLKSSFSRFAAFVALLCVICQIVVLKNSSVSPTRQCVFFEFFLRVVFLLLRLSYTSSNSSLAALFFFFSDLPDTLEPSIPCGSGVSSTTLP